MTLTCTPEDFEWSPDAAPAPNEMIGFALDNSRVRRYPAREATSLNGRYQFGNQEKIFENREARAGKKGREEREHARRLKG